MIEKEFMEKLILYLFKSKAFNEESAIVINKEFITKTSNNRLYLTLKGKFAAHGILAHGKLLNYNICKECEKIILDTKLIKVKGKFYHVKCWEKKTEEYYEGY